MFKLLGLFAALSISMLWVSVASYTLLPPRKAENNKPGVCQNKKAGERVSLEGYFGLNKYGSIVIEGGYENIHPYGRFTFSTKQEGKAEFEAALYVMNTGINGSEKANRTEPKGKGDNLKWQIYDNERKEISFNDRVRITGFTMDDCTVQVERIEKL